MRHWLFAFALIPACPAWADTLSSATVTNMAYALVDLDTGDGITPAIRFNASSDYNAFVGGSLYLDTVGALKYQTTLEVAADKFGPVEARIASGSGYARASVSGDGSLGGTILQASGASFSSPDHRFAYFAGAGVLGNAQNAFIAQAFSLTPNTRVVFRVDMRVSAEVSFTGLPAAAGQEGTSGYAELRVFEQGEGPNVGPQFMLDEVSTWANAAGQTSTEERTAQVQFDNTGTIWLDGNVNVTAAVDGHAYYFTPAVPEPGSLGLLAGGLSCMALWCRRRREKAGGRVAMITS